MPMIFQAHIKRDDLLSNPDRLYLFGDNEVRRGYGGLAAECRGEPNAVGVATKRAPHRRPDAYWSDDDLVRVVPIIDADLARAFVHVARGGTVVCPTAGLGTGMAELPTRAPRINAYLTMRLTDLGRVPAP